MVCVIFKIFAISLIILNSLEYCYGATNRNQDRTITDNYAVLADDIKWVFRSVGNFAGTVERMLPNATVTATKNRSFSENTRLTLLVGLRHVLTGVREISMTFEQSFKTDHIKQLHQLKNVTNFVNDIVSALKMWFGQIRALVMHIMRLYNRYIPEVLFGKCLGNYLISTYPDRSYFEYPFILLTEIYSSVITTTESPTDLIVPTELQALEDDINMEQNEISHSDADDLNTTFLPKSPRHVGTTTQMESNQASVSSTSESFFNLSNVLDDNKDRIIENAVNQHSWQICLKLYTAESISRSLKSYFLSL